MKQISLSLFLLLTLSCGKNNETSKVKLMTLDPGHFHAALIQKTSYDEIDAVVDVYAPDGPEVRDFLNKIEGYNSREDNPTNWTIRTHFSENFLDDMIDQKPGNVMVVSGKNSNKIDYILAAVNAGLNVYADKPLVINEEGFKKLERFSKLPKKKIYWFMIS